MTTIAYKDGTMAADSLVVTGNIKDATTVKIARNEHGDLCGAAGTAAFVWALRQWFLEGEKVEPPAPEKSDAGVVIRANGTIECYEMPGPYPFELQAKVYAIGSGRELALGAMAFGASAAEAVKVAALYDTKTGGKIISLSH